MTAYKVPQKGTYISTFPYNITVICCSSIRNFFLVIFPIKIAPESCVPIVVFVMFFLVGRNQSCCCFTEDKYDIT